MERLQQAHDELEERVKQRTAELRSSNEQLVELNQQLSDSEERFRAAYQQAAVGLEMLSLDGMYLEGNDTLSNILGYMHSELRKLSFRDITDIGDIEREQPLIDALIEGRVKSYTIEKRYIRKTGEPVWVRVTSSIAKTSEPYRISIIEDITERKRLEEDNRRNVEELAAMNEELRVSQEELQRYSSQLEEIVEDRTKEVAEARERLESFMDSATEAFFIYDSDLRLVDLNPAALALYPVATRREGLLGRGIVEVAPGIEKMPMYEEYKRVLSTGLPYRDDEAPVIQSLGNRWVSIHAFKMGDNLGIMRRDVTERVRLEERLRETQRLEAIDRISAMVAHDVRSPLTTAAQALYMAKHRPDRAEEMMSMAERNIKRAIEMIEELRENTRLIEPRRSNVDMEALIEDTIREKPIKEDVRVESSVGKGLKKVIVDPGLMRRVLENLLSNAAEAMPSGGMIKVDARREGGDVVLSVSDTGVGISEEVGDKVFSPLYTTKPRGVGLGLPFCKRAVEAHGGSIGFNSDPGQGTTFTVKIPLKSV
jgi:PAS domain S-box-containing protein